MLMMDNISEEERRDFARTILNSGQTLLTLLNDILDFSKIEAGRLELENTVIDPAHLLHEIANLFNENATGKGLMLACHWEGAAQNYLADPHRLRQMLSNLTNNAIKFTRQGKVTLSAREIERSEGKACIEFSVEDTGIGIDKDKLPLLFTPFSQADASITRQFGGTGLGLSIVRSIATKMGGSVGVESAPGEGARFWFRIQADVLDSYRGEKQSDAGNPEASDLSGKPSGHILVVEDNPTNQKVIASLLSKLGFSCQIVGDGAAGVQAVETDPSIALILMDVQMPVMDGYEATGAIRTMDMLGQQRHRPIIAMTANAFEEDRQLCLNAGMDDFLTKPIDLEKLKLTLQYWLRA
jgi:CheY-like chemotaxis protein